MRDINEAFFILSDDEAKERYDAELRKYMSNTRSSSVNLKEEPASTTYYHYEPTDQTLNDWIKKAQKQAAQLVQEALREGKAITKEGIKGGIEQAAIYIKFTFWASLAGFILFSIIIPSDIRAVVFQNMLIPAIFLYAFYMIIKFVKDK